MGDLVPLPSSSGALTTALESRKQQLADYEKRLREAQELEAKLNKIQEEVPTRIYNVAGSCAGAGSGDFHYYRAVRRAEQDRVRRLDEEERAEAERRDFEEKLKKRQLAQEEKTAKKRSKRQKQKDKRKAAKAAKGEDGGGDAAAAGGGSSGSESGGEEQPGLD